MIVRFAPEAREAIRDKRAWWERKRDEAPELFVIELREVVAKLRVAPTEGAQRYVTHRGKRIWRHLMKKTRHHVYFRIDKAAGVVEVITVWNAQGGKPRSFSS